MLFLTLITIGLAAGVMASLEDDTGDETIDIDVTRNPDGNEDVNLTEDHDLFLGASNGEEVTAGGGDDMVFGEGGDDTIHGGSGTDVLMGQEGDDSLSGGMGDDLLMDGSGSDTLSGGSGSDTIYSGDFTDVDALADQVSTGSIDLSDQALDALLDVSFDTDSDAADGDVADGGSGNDVLVFGEADTVTGGSGSDLFFAGDWMSGGEAAVLEDFDPGEDVLLYSHDGTGADPVISHQDDGGDRVILADGVPVIRLVGHAGSTSVTAGDVLLAERT